MGKIFELRKIREGIDKIFHVDCVRRLDVAFFHIGRDENVICRIGDRDDQHRVIVRRSGNAEHIQKFDDQFPILVDGNGEILGFVRGKERGAVPDVVEPAVFPRCFDDLFPVKGKFVGFEFSVLVFVPGGYHRLAVNQVESPLVFDADKTVFVENQIDRRIDENVRMGECEPRKRADEEEKLFFHMGNIS